MEKKVFKKKDLKETKINEDFEYVPYSFKTVEEMHNYCLYGIVPENNSQEK